jgi:uncharacterized protein YfaS (alpha-2-macroglobulin family)
LPERGVNSPRLQTHIFTDKVVYRPNDVIFVEVLVVDAFNKTPTVMSMKELYNYNYYLTMSLEDPTGTSVYSSKYSNVVNSTATFTYKIPIDAVGGEYTVKVVTSGGQVTPAIKLIRIRDYPRDLINVKVDLPLESYRPGDAVNGKIKAELPDGSPFEVAPIFSLSANFESETTEGASSTESVSLTDQKMSVLGEAFFTFVIPKLTT